MPNITLYEFNLLPKEDQHSLVHSKGTFLEVKEIDEVKYVLYGLQQFYVELEYNIPSNSITALTTFMRGIKLDKYLDSYDI